MRLHDVFRGQVLSFTASEHHGNELVSFLPRPVVAAHDIVLPDGLLEHIEAHIIGVADWSAELLGAGPARCSAGTPGAGIRPVRHKATGLLWGWRVGGGPARSATCWVYS